MAPTQQATKSKSAADGAVKKGIVKGAKHPGAKKHRSKSYEGYASFIQKLVKKHLPEQGGISSEAVNVLEGLLDYLVVRLGDSMDDLVLLKNTKTLSSEALLAGLGSWPSELANLASAQAVAAITRYNSSREAVAAE